jgi:hypothetical protein
MALDRPGIRLSVLDSALILAVFSAICYVMGHAAQLRAARQLGLPLSLMPSIGPETFILVGGRYLILFGALGLLLYFLWIRVGRRIRIINAKLDPVWLGIESRAKKHPYVYLLLICLASATVFYSLPVLLPLTPRSVGGPATFDPNVYSEVVELRLKEPELNLEERSFRYLWPHQDMVVLQDKGSSEFVLIKEDEIRLIILSRSK